MYHALYRKYRPKDFDSVVGQEVIIKTLKNSIKTKKFSHAYLFYGPRGTGKTTVSKIFARNVNCLDSKDGIACGKCKACKASFSNDCMDIIEIDAASNNGVDEIRELKNKISLVPSELKYKVYIIDEVHMLSIGAFNALLKTLEEPPDHAIFILATTDFQKVPSTIVSRCQCFSFQRISDLNIENRLNYICESENIDIDKDVLKKISILCDGGLRDAIGMLDKLVSYTNDKIELNDFYELNGIISDDDIKTFIDYILSGNIVDVLKRIDFFNNRGKNLIQIMMQVVNYLRDKIVDYYVSDIDLNYSIDIYQKFVNFLNEKMLDIKKSDNPKINIEMTILMFISKNVKTETKREKMDYDIKDENKEKSIDSYNGSNLNIRNDFEVDNETSDKSDISKIKMDDYVSNDESDKPKILNIDEIMKVRVNNTFVGASKNILKNELTNFDRLKDYTFSQDFGYVVCAILDGTLRLASDDSIVISYEYDSNVGYNLNIIDKITEIYNKINNCNKKIAIISDEYWNSAKDEYIANLRNKKKYEYINEPVAIYENNNDNNIRSSSAVNLFGDVVEVD